MTQNRERAHSGAARVRASGKQIELVFWGAFSLSTARMTGSTQIPLLVILCSGPVLFLGLIFFVHSLVRSSNRRLAGHDVVYRPMRVRTLELVLNFRLFLAIVKQAMTRRPFDDFLSSGGGEKGTNAAAGIATVRNFAHIISSNANK